MNYITARLALRARVGWGYPTLMY